MHHKIVQGKKPDSEYKKVPVVVIHNRQINDSYIVVKSLAHILDGAPLTKELIEIEEMTTYGLMVALEADVASDCSSLVACAPHFGCCICALVTSCSCIICCVAPGVFRKRNPEMQSLDYYSKTYTTGLGAKQYFHGDKPGIVDVSICGVLAPFIKGGRSNTIKKFLGTTGPLSDWFNRMKPTLPDIF